MDGQLNKTEGSECPHNIVENGRTFLSHLGWTNTNFPSIYIFCKFWLSTYHVKEALGSVTNLIS